MENKAISQAQLVCSTLWLSIGYPRVLPTSVTWSDVWPTVSFHLTVLSLWTDPISLGRSGSLVALCSDTNATLCSIFYVLGLFSFTVRSLRAASQCYFCMCFELPREKKILLKSKEGKGKGERGREGSWSRLDTLRNVSRELRGYFWFTTAIINLLGGTGMYVLLGHVYILHGKLGNNFAHFKTESFFYCWVLRVLYMLWIQGIV